MALGLTSDQEAIREGVAELCLRFPGEYWRALDRESAYPEHERAKRWEEQNLSLLLGA